MMKKKSFLAGITGLGLIFALILTGCSSDGGDGGGGGGGGGQSLLGTWANDQDFANLNSVVIFTNVDHTGPGIVGGTKLAYYAQNLTGNIDYTIEGTTYKIPVQGVNGSPFTATLDLSANKFSLAGFVAVTTENPTGKLDFTRAAGTSYEGTSNLSGVWVSDLDSPNKVIILIGAALGRKVWSATGANVAAPNYRLTEDAGITYVIWNAGAPAAYTRTTVGNTENLNIPPPGGGAALNFKPLYATAKF
ncbi:MAG: hypothetical protein LBK05_04065 [Treponema sp.]|jgi:hypothetical protein|nr:hypothetical protein [Treponema sp.]